MSSCSCNQMTVFGVVRSGVDTLRSHLQNHRGLLRLLLLLLGLQSGFTHRLRFLLLDFLLSRRGRSNFFCLGDSKRLNWRCRLLLLLGFSFRSSPTKPGGVACSCWTFQSWRLLVALPPMKGLFQTLNGIWYFRNGRNYRSGNFRFHRRLKLFKLLVQRNVSFCGFLVHQNIRRRTVSAGEGNFCNWIRTCLKKKNMTQKKPSNRKKLVTLVTKK